MASNVYQMHTDCKPLCAGARLFPADALGDTLCMGRHFLRAWRKHRNKTLETVAAELHMSHSQLSRIERGQQPYNQELLEELAELYMCDVVDLLIRDPSDPDGLWSISDQLEPVQRQQLVEFAKVLKRTGTEG